MSKINKEILAYYPCYHAQPDEYKTLPYDLLTTIGYGQVTINSDGSITPSTNYDPAPIVQYAHTKGVKIVLVFKDTNDTPADAMLANPSTRTNLVKNLLDDVTKYGFDGVNSNIENIGDINIVTHTPNKPLVTLFHTELADTFWAKNPNYYVAISVGIYYPDIDNIFDLSVLKNKMNYLKMMGYDWFFTLPSRAGSQSPIRTDSGMGIYDSVRHYEGLVGKNKLLLGVPWYGYEWPTVNDERLAVITGDREYISYKDYIKVIDGYNKKWDNTWKTPWYTRLSEGKWLQGHYNDLRSLGIKYDLVNSEGIAGIAIWTVTHGTNRPELWQLIKNKFRKKR